MGWLPRLLTGTRAAAPQRWVVVDVETSGMDATRDALIAVGAVALVDGRVVPKDSFELIVRQVSASARANILVHGVGAAAQLNGVDPPRAVRAFLDYVGQAPLLAFHARFDRGFIARAVKAYVNQPFDNPWLDIADLAPALDKTGLRSLDEWLRHYSIPVSARHSAASDAFATALLTMRLLSLAARAGTTSFAGLQRLARHAKWLH
ncbi:MAG TPA: 3'-5' exonuclease [Burkholderiaceae bacterium]|nr:3'-5' exonuclease [Burkholderiaceae bacterium]